MIAESATKGDDCNETAIGDQQALSSRFMA